MALPDLSLALRSFQQALDNGQIALRPGSLDAQLFVHLDRPNGELRLTYVRLEQAKVTALVQFIQADPVAMEPCFSVGWAVPEELWGQGRVGEAFMAAVKELRHGMAPQGMTAFWIEGIVGADNKASQRAAEKVISAPVATDTDSHAGVPVVQYIRRIDAQTQL